MIVSYDIDGVLAEGPPPSEKKWGRMNKYERMERKRFLIDWYKYADPLYEPLDPFFFAVSARKNEYEVYHATKQWLDKYFSQGVAEDTQNSNEIRNQLNSLMDQDRQYSNPTERVAFQAKVWPYIQQNIKTILADKGEKGNGDYPASPYAAWLLVQHMDAYPQRQIEFYNQLKKAIPNHPKIQFLRDRAAVNQWILKNADDPRFFTMAKHCPIPL